MYAEDFEYDGRLLSNYGFIICEFSGTNELSVSEGIHQITFDKVKRNSGKRFSLIDTKYDECVHAKIQICKNPCDFTDMSISNAEYRDLVRWLNRREFLKFRLINEEDVEYSQCYFNASFNIQKVMINDVLYGLDLTMETDAPFGYGVPFERTWTVAAGDTVQFEDMSDEIGQICPEITILCMDDGDIAITNTSYASYMQIKNCTNGEEIHIDGDTQIITTSMPSHKIMNDFNYEFLHIGNGYNNRLNVLSFSKPCRFTMKYYPVVKDIF